MSGCVCLCVRAMFHAIDIFNSRIRKVINVKYRETGTKHDAKDNIIIRLMSLAQTLFPTDSLVSL